MKRVYIYCEGQTEETFVNTVLYQYFIGRNIALFPIVCMTGNSVSKKFSGGIASYAKIKREISALCKEHKDDGYVTTMIDYYGMPKDTPAVENLEVDLYKRIAIIEEAITEDIKLSNFKFNFMLHEFEGILFSDPNAFKLISDETIVEKIREIKDSCKTPEHINSSIATAPSKRLLQLMPGYRKIVHGTLISQKIGIDKIIDECPHFRQWIEWIVSC